MNLIDAIKSGRRFRQKGTYAWLIVDGNLLRWPDDGGARPPSISEVIADDWEIEEPTVQITRTQFWDSVRETLIAEGTRKEIIWQGSQEDLFRQLAHGMLGALARKLGLEP